MALWAIISRDTGELLHPCFATADGQTPADAGWAWDAAVQEAVPLAARPGATDRWDPAARAFVAGPPPRVALSPLAFQRLFTQGERIAIRGSADPIVQDFMALSAIAADIDLGDPDVVAGVGYLQAVGLIGAGRAAAILGGGAT